MRNLLERAATTAFGAAGLYPTALTDAGDLRALIAALAPVEAALIRLGPEGDGGYLVPDDLGGIAACFSPGVSSISGFELACAERGMQVLLADKSVDGPAEAHPRFSFIKKHVGAATSGDVVSMDDWVAQSLPDSQSELLLQMDIEGAEYETLLATSEPLLRRFRIIVIELHWLNHLWSKPFFRVASGAFRKLLRTHICVHIHPNNCCGIVTRKGLETPRVAEFTFLRNDRVTSRAYATRFPHPLDRDNIAGKPPLPLPASWIGGA
jgi:Methyltransferase FkbM domain